MHKAVFNSYKKFENIDGFSKIVPNTELLENKGSLNIAQYISNVDTENKHKSIDEALLDWNRQSEELNKSMSQLFRVLN